MGKPAIHKDHLTSCSQIGDRQLQTCTIYLLGLMMRGCFCNLQARKVAAAIEESQRLARLNEQAGGTMVTGVSFATVDADDGDGLQHLNIILKVASRAL